MYGKELSDSKKIQGASLIADQLLASQGFFVVSNPLPALLQQSFMLVYNEIYQRARVLQRKVFHGRV
jgi:hypothetical protein